MGSVQDKIQPVIPLIDPLKLKCGLQSGATNATGATQIRFYDAHFSIGARNGGYMQFARIGFMTVAALAAVVATCARRFRVEFRRNALEPDIEFNSGME